ncbi:DUF6174 domain-containing protein [Thalassotalea mangrovi]|uniref:Lipoprotein n=1 Tax=Thalassotalea mangrovi TaxID=2572245 RepID=A0A4U1B6P7_9GAMM|nr:DUF6174 domain-containing protein [Thalassotalea mangrovi]TKB45591.1 hypothetical protein E8M12_08320 [Thalassotalea mangrovi]
MNRLLLLTLTLLLTACGSDDEPEQQSLSELVTENQQLWVAQGLMDYQYSVQIALPDCETADELPPVDIVVEDNQVVGVYIQGSGEPLELEESPTIDDLFYFMLAILIEQPLQFSATAEDDNLPVFDANLGYPVSFFIDYSAASCDAYQYQILSFN